MGLRVGKGVGGADCMGVGGTSLGEFDGLADGSSQTSDFVMMKLQCFS